MTQNKIIFSDSNEQQSYVQKCDSPVDREGRHHPKISYVVCRRGGGRRTGLGTLCRETSTENKDQ